MKHLVLLGAGHAHMQVLQSLARQPIAGASVTLVSPLPRQLYSGMVPGVLAGAYALEDCATPLEPLAGAAGVRWIAARATGLDADARRLRLDNGDELGYDVLSVDTGPVVDYQAIPGAREHALFVRPFDELVRRWSLVLEQAQARPLSIAVIGGGAAGFEISMAVHHRLRQIQPGSRVTLITGGVEPLDTYSRAVQACALAALKRRNITVLREACTAVGPDRVALTNGARLICDAAIVAVSAGAPEWPRQSGLQLTAEGFIATNAYLQSPSHPEVFAAGDAASRIDVQHPRSGVHAVKAGAPLALNLRRVLEGGPLRRYRPPAWTLNLLACGPREAIGAWGPWVERGRWVWFWKDLIDRRYVASWRRAQ